MKINEGQAPEQYINVRLLSPFMRRLSCHSISTAPADIGKVSFVFVNLLTFCLTKISHCTVTTRALLQHIYW